MNVLPSYGLIDIDNDLWYDPYDHKWRSAPFFPYVSIHQSHAAFVDLDPPVHTAKILRYQPGHDYDHTISLDPLPPGPGD